MLNLNIFNLGVAKIKPTFCMVLHAYQPPTQTEYILKRIVKNCYLPVMTGLLMQSSTKVTLNINGSLSEMLSDQYPEVIEKIEDLYKNDQLEFLESAAYHPILPLLPPRDRVYQISLNSTINQEIFGNIYKPIGFFPPELAVSRDVIRQLALRGYEYVIVPPLALPMRLHTELPYFHVQGRKRHGTTHLIPRNHEISNEIAFRKYQQVSELFTRLTHLQRSVPMPTICAMDIETFGEHNKGYESFLIELLAKTESITAKTVLFSSSDYEIFDICSCSWSTSSQDIENRVPYPLWEHPLNSIHQLVNLHLDLINETSRLLDEEQKGVADEKYQRYNTARILIAKAQHSDTTWWAGGHGHWSPAMIQRGLALQKFALETAKKTLNNQEHAKRVEIFLEMSDWIFSRIKRLTDA
ncbi:MAG: hypothetical protein ACFFCW_12110 [Candidatus Hodarchaeota archaeon]